MDVTTAYNGGPSEEKQQLRRRLEADRCYVMDRRFAEFALWNDIVRVNSSYVCRIRDNSNLSELVEERPLRNAAKQAGVIGDAVIRLGWKHQRPDHPVRVVQIRTTPHKKTGGRKGGTAGPASDGIIRIATNLLEPPSLGHRIVLPLFQACPGMPAPNQPGSGRHSDSSLLRHHCLFAHSLVDRRPADAAKLRDDLFLFVGLGRPR